MQKAKLFCKSSSFSFGSKMCCFFPVVELWNSGKTDSTTGLWVQIGVNRNQRTKQAQVFMLIWINIDRISASILLMMLKRSLSCGPQQVLHHKNILLLLPLANLLRFFPHWWKSIFNIWLRWSTPRSLPGSESRCAGVAKSSLSASYYSDEGENHLIGKD